MEPGTFRRFFLFFQILLLCLSLGFLSALPLLTKLDAKVRLLENYSRDIAEKQKGNQVKDHHYCGWHVAHANQDLIESRTFLIVLERLSKDPVGAFFLVSKLDNLDTIKIKGTI